MWRWRAPTGRCSAIERRSPHFRTTSPIRTMSREQFAKVKAALNVYLFHTQPHFLGQKIPIGYPTAILDTKQAPELAELMCRQLQNVGTFLEYREIVEAKFDPVRSGSMPTRFTTRLSRTIPTTHSTGSVHTLCPAW